MCIRDRYAIAGTVRGLEALEEEVERRREISGGKRSFILVPGIDVPFHSRVLRVGVADFRRSLERVMPRDKDPNVIVGRYIPNLVPRPFTLDRDFIQEIRDLVPAEPLDEILADYDTWRTERPRELARTVLIELLDVYKRQGRTPGFTTAKSSTTSRSMPSPAGRRRSTGSSPPRSANYAPAPTTTTSVSKT